MASSAIPTNYNEWHHCITVECGLTLTPEYISERITALQSDKDEHTRQFVRLYGEPYRQQVLAWFEHAQQSA